MTKQRLNRAFRVWQQKKVFEFWLYDIALYIQHLITCLKNGIQNPLISFTLTCKDLSPFLLTLVSLYIYLECKFLKNRCVSLKLFRRIKCMPHSEELHQGKLHAHMHHLPDTMWNPHSLSHCSCALLSHRQHSDPLSLFPNAPLNQPSGIHTSLQLCTCFNRIVSELQQATRSVKY